MCEFKELEGLLGKIGKLDDHFGFKSVSTFIMFKNILLVNENIVENKQNIFLNKIFHLNKINRGPWSDP